MTARRRALVPALGVNELAQLDREAQPRRPRPRVRNPAGREGQAAPSDSLLLMAENYEYRGLVAESWDLLRGDYAAWPDRPFYRTIIERHGEPALDVGCGTGRLTLDYLAGGLDVDGVDNSPEMLAICREKAAALDIDVRGRLFEQEMEKLQLPRKYATIFVPSSSFQLLTEEDTANEAMRRFRTHLQPGGVLVMSIMSKLWPGRETPFQMVWSDWFKIGEKRRPHDGAVIRRWVRARYDHGAQLEDEENRYEVLIDDEVIATEQFSRSPAVRWYSQGQIAAVFERAGFSAVQLTRGFTEVPATQPDTTFCVLGTRR